MSAKDRILDYVVLHNGISKYTLMKVFDPMNWIGSASKGIAPQVADRRIRELICAGKIEYHDFMGEADYEHLFVRKQ